MTASIPVYISADAAPAFKDYIRLLLSKQSDFLPASQLTEVFPTEKTYAAVCSHPDLYHCNLGSRIVSGAPAGSAYPQNIGYNGVRLGGYFIHNLHFTAPDVMAEVERLNLTKVNVKQGYTKCNLVVVESGFSGDRPAVITADRGIAKALLPLPVDVLVIHQGHVLLPGFPYGFLGGASGSVGKEILFHGNLSAHPDYAEIKDFIYAEQKYPVWFSTFPLTDIGSIITLL